MKKKTVKKSLADSHAAELRRLQLDIESVNRMFDMTDDPALIEYCIYTLKALNARHDFLLEKIRHLRKDAV